MAVRKFLRRVFMMVSDQERAVDLLYAFEHGKMSVPARLWLLPWIRAHLDAFPGALKDGP